MFNIIQWIGNLEANKINIIMDYLLRDDVPPTIVH